jgi:hypothetical protein
MSAEQHASCWHMCSNTPCLLPADVRCHAVPRPFCRKLIPAALKDMVWAAWREGFDKCKPYVLTGSLATITGVRAYRFLACQGL